MSQRRHEGVEASSTKAAPSGGAEAGGGTLSRRRALGLTAGAVGASVIGVAFAVKRRTQPEAPATVGAVSAPGFEARLFNSEQVRLVEALVDDMIPETDSPGALRAGVPAFIEDFVREVYDEPDRAAFLAGLDALDAAARGAHARPFSACSPDERAALLAPRLVEGEAWLAVDVPLEDAPFCFIAAFHELCIEGFCHSRLGATRVLQYESVPGAYHGCVPLQSVGRAWATS